METFLWIVKPYLIDSNWENFSSKCYVTGRWQMSKFANFFKHQDDLLLKTWFIRYHKSKVTVVWKLPLWGDRTCQTITTIQATVRNGMAGTTVFGEVVKCELVCRWGHNCGICDGAPTKQSSTFRCAFWTAWLLLPSIYIGHLFLLWSYSTLFTFTALCNISFAIQCSSLSRSTERTHTHLIILLLHHKVCIFCFWVLQKVRFFLGSRLVLREKEAFYWVFVKFTAILVLLKSFLCSFSPFL